jgi:hypothetical protein
MNTKGRTVASYIFLDVGFKVGVHAAEPPVQGRKAPSTLRDWPRARGSPPDPRLPAADRGSPLSSIEW